MGGVNRSSHTRSKEKKNAQKKSDGNDSVTVTAVKGPQTKRAAESKTSSSTVEAPVKKRVSHASSTIAATSSTNISFESSLTDSSVPLKEDPLPLKSKKRPITHKSAESLQLPTPATTSNASTPLPQPPEPGPELGPEPTDFLPDTQSLPSYATSSATKVLQKQLKQIIKFQLSTTLGQERYWTLDLSRLDNLYTWYFSLSSFDPDIPLSADMRSYGINSVQLEVKFGPQHPHSPPFVRIIKPRFMQWMNGGGGHVTAGGSICIEMLTMKGWKKDYTLEQVLLVVHQALSDVDPVPARLIGTYEYSVQEAVYAYIRVARTHGWRVPQNWNTLFTSN